MAGAWGKAAGSAWADDVDKEEAENGPLAAPVAYKAPREDDFPTLGVAAKKAATETKKDKKKKQTMSLADFNKSGPSVGPAMLGPRRPAAGVDLMSLPTAPRVRPEGEAAPERGARGRFGDRDEERRDRFEDDGPSRADQSDSWGADRRAAPPGGDSYERRGGGYGGGGGGGFQGRDGSRERGGGFDDGPSRADGADDWGKNKAYVPSSSGAGGGGSRGFGAGGFGERRGYEERPEGAGGYRERESFREVSKADTEDRWSRAPATEFKPTGFDDRRHESDAAPRRGFGFEDRPRELSRDRWERAPRDSSGGPPRSRDASREGWRPGGAAAGGDGAPRERPKLSLAPRSAPVGEAAEAGAAARPSLFGAARPREEVLKERGVDTVDEEGEEAAAAEAKAPVQRDETAEEQALAKSIADLQIRVEAGEADAEWDGAQEGESKTVAQALDGLQQQLSTLKLENDSKAAQAGAGGRSAEPRQASSRAADEANNWRRREPLPEREQRNGSSSRGGKEREEQRGREGGGREQERGRYRSSDRGGTGGGGYEREERAAPPPRREGGW